VEGSALLFMLLSWGLILGLNIFCFTLLLTRTENVNVSPTNRRAVGKDEEEEIT